MQPRRQAFLQYQPCARFCPRCQALSVNKRQKASYILGEGGQTEQIDSMFSGQCSGEKASRESRERGGVC